MLKPFYILILLVFGTQLFTACENNSSNFDANYETQEENIGVMMNAPPPVKTANYRPNEPEPIQQQIIKNGNMHIQVKDYAKARQQITAISKNLQAYISTEQEANNNYEISNTIVLRVPSQNFEKLTDSISTIAEKIVSKNINSKDVTEEFVDIQARIRNKKEVEKRYVSILSQAKTIEDILKVEEHLRVLREEIESREGRLQYLSNQVSMSTLSVQFYQVLPYTAAATHSVGFGYKFRKAFLDGWNGFIHFLLGLMHLWPFILLLIVLIILYKKGYYKFKQKKAAG